MPAMDHDVLIVGGGISGLYAAWRLMTTTSLRVAVVEASERFGGRYHTIIMPGGFPADLGAMRFMPLNHQILYRLCLEMGLEVEKFYIKAEMATNTHRDYYKNRHVSTANQKAELFEVRSDERQYFGPTRSAWEFDISPERDMYEVKCKTTGMMAKDMSKSLYLSLPMNPEIISFGDEAYPMMINMADTIAWHLPFDRENQDDSLSGYHCIKGGMEQLIKKIVEQLSNCERISLHKNANVTLIKETNDQFNVKTEDGSTDEIQCRRLILACNERGINYISWSSPYTRNTQFQRLFSKINHVKAVKIFLTYRTPWWEQRGLVTGSLHTDLTVNEITAFGSRGKTSEYATLLAAFTYCNTEIFEGLNMSVYPRFENKVGMIPEEVKPSQLLVEYVQKQLSRIFDMKEIPTPVCAVTKLWLGAPISANYEAKVGVRADLLQWRGLKPFPNAEIYVTGDTFTSCFDTGSSLGWSEGAMLNSERVVTQYFGVSPFVQGLPLAEEHTVKSKL